MKSNNEDCKWGKSGPKPNFIRRDYPSPIPFFVKFPPPLHHSTSYKKARFRTPSWLAYDKISAYALFSIAEIDGKTRKIIQKKEIYWI